MSPYLRCQCTSYIHHILYCIYKWKQIRHCGHITPSYTLSHTIVKATSTSESLNVRICWPNWLKKILIFYFDLFGLHLIFPVWIFSIRNNCIKSRVPWGFLDISRVLLLTWALVDTVTSPWVPGFIPSLFPFYRDFSWQRLGLWGLTWRKHRFSAASETTVITVSPSK